MKNWVKLIAPAKVNLVLAVGDVREDGFHRVHTIMHTLALHDTITMRRFEEEDIGKGLELRFKCETSGDIDPLDVPAEKNIAYRAVKELAQALDRHVDESIDITLSKVIPAEAGLGGGSSNAAAALLGAATLWGIDPQDERLLAVAGQLGADVSFFLKGGCAFLSGKGEVFEHTLTPRKGFALLVRPSAGVSTAKAYAEFDKNPQYPESEFIKQLTEATDASQVAFWNNLTDAACAVTPEVAEVLAWAQGLSQDQEVLLCGSGSAVCIPCESYDDACAYSVEAFKRNWWSRITTFSPVGASVVQVY